MTDRILINRENILTIQRTQRLVDRTVERLATGLSVNSALDNPQNFFTARSLNNRASDLTRRLDGIGNSIRTIQQSMTGVETIERLLNQGEAIVLDELAKLRAGGTVQSGPTDTLSTLITQDSPVAYWRLNDTSGTTATNLGSIGAAVDGTYTNGPNLGAAALYTNGDVSANFDGVDDSIAIPDNAGINLDPQTNRTIELVFNADTTTGRQVLYEEGATVNSFSIYILNGRLYVSGRDEGAWGPPDISTAISAGETYHVAFTFDSAGEFIGYVNGQEIGREPVNATFPAHSGDIGIGAMREASWFHDGFQSGEGFYFDGRISDVAIYNDTLSDIRIAQHAAAVTVTAPPIENDDFNKVLDQITQTAIDSSYRGLQLLLGENLQTLFNADGSNLLSTEGENLTAEAFGITRNVFNNETTLEAVLVEIRNSLEIVRNYGRSLTNDINMLQIRDDFTRALIGTLESGADDLTTADMNEEGSNLLALQTRQQLAITALTIASQSDSAILNLFA